MPPITLRISPIANLSDSQLSAVQMLATGLSVPTVADELGLHKTTVYRWMENNRDFRRAATSARLDALEAHTVEAREIVGGVWVRLARRFADFDDHWDDLSWTDKIKVTEMMLKHFKTPEDRTTYKKTEELKAEIKWPSTGLPAGNDAIEADAVPVDDEPSD